MSYTRTKLKQLESASQGAIPITNLNGDMEFTLIGSDGQILTVVGGVPQWSTLNFPSEFETYNEVADFPTTGSTDVIYFALLENQFFIWNGVTYTQVPTSASFSFTISGNQGSNQNVGNGDTLSVLGSGVVKTTASNTDNLSIEVSPANLDGKVLTTRDNTTVWDSLTSNDVSGFTVDVQEIIDNYLNTGVTGTTAGSATEIPIIVYNSKGQIVTISTATINLPIANGGTNNNSLPMPSGNITPIMFFDGTKITGDSNPDHLGYDETTDTVHTSHISVTTATSQKGIEIINTVTSGASSGAGLGLYSNDNFTLALGDRFGYMLLGGNDGVNATVNAAGFQAYATEVWSNIAHGSKVTIETTPNGSTTRGVAVMIDQDKSATFYNKIIKNGGLSSEFLKANGDVDSTSYTPTSRSITINGITYDLSADRTWTISASGGITTLNTLTGSTQTFATGTSGTNFNISSVGTTHTFNIPDASITNRGVVTPNAQTFTGAKTIKATGSSTNIFPFSIEKFGTSTQMIQFDRSGGIYAFPDAYGGSYSTISTTAGSKFLWLPEGAAIRAGYTNGTQWSSGSIGNLSAAFGFNTTASGGSSISWGQGGVSSANYSTTGGVGCTASGTGSFAIGESSTASNSASIALGFAATASGVYSVAFTGGLSSARNSMTNGSGSVASADYAHAFGRSVLAKGFGEFVVGTFSTSYTPVGNTSTPDSADRIFNVANGTSSGNSDAFTVLRSGKVGVDIDNFEANASAGAKLQVNGTIKTIAAKYDSDAAAGIAGLTAGEEYQTSGLGGTFPFNVVGIKMVKQ